VCSPCIGDELLVDVVDGMSRVACSCLLLVVVSVTAASLPSVDAQSAAGGLHYSVDEELPVGTRVADLVLDARLHKHGVDALRMMTFRLLNQQTGGLVVDESSGVLSVGSRLDREQLCPGVHLLCQIKLDVAVQPMTYFQIIKVHMHSLRTPRRERISQFRFHQINW